MTAEDLLEKFSDFIQTHQSKIDELQAAAEQLAGKDDSEVAFQKLLTPITTTTINVFFSYKKKDERTATKIVSILKKLSAGKLIITYMAEFTKDIAGKNWSETIRQSIKDANWFILLLPDPSDDWDWCLFETGLFEGHLTSADRLICLHHPDVTKPSPISEYHAVEATIKEISKFLEMVLVEPDPIPGMKPLNPSFKEDIPQYAQQIVDVIRPPITLECTEIFEPCIELKAVDAESLVSIEELDHAIVLYANKEALQLFGFIKKPETWGVLRKDLVIPESDERWLKELFHVIRRIANNRSYYPIQAVLQITNGKTYKPNLHGIKRVGKHGPIASYIISFTEDIGALDHSNMPKEVSVLASLLRIAFRFRWEVLQRFTDNEIEDIDVDRLEISLDRITNESVSRGITDQTTIVDLFPEEQKCALDKIFNEWYKIRNEQETGSLDIALKNRNIREIQTILRMFLPLNQSFLEITADRFSEMINKQHQPGDSSSETAEN